jgi:hypothetical protein
MNKTFKKLESLKNKNFETLKISGACSAVRITYFHVPQFVNRRNLVTLECHFEMTGDPNLVRFLRKYDDLCIDPRTVFFHFKATTLDRSGIRSHDLYLRASEDDTSRYIGRPRFSPIFGEIIRVFLIKQTLRSHFCKN